MTEIEVTRRVDIFTEELHTSLCIMIGLNSEMPKVNKNLKLPYSLKDIKGLRLLK